MSTTTDVSTRTTLLYPRASDVTSAQVTAILDVIRDNIQEDLFTSFPESFQGQQRITPTEISAPTATISAVAGNIDNGNYRYKISFVDSARESQIGIASSVVNVEDNTSSGQMSLTNIPTGDDETTARKVYRQQNGTGEYYLLGTISDNTTTTYTDNVAQATAVTNGLPLYGQAVASDFFRPLAVMDGSYRVEIRKKSEDAGDTSSTAVATRRAERTTKNYVWFDYEDRVDGTSQETINFDPDNSFSDELMLIYRKKISNATAGAELPYPTSLHSRMLNMLAYGLALYYLIGKTGEDDHVSKLQVLYEDAKDTFFSGSISQKYG